MTKNKITILILSVVMLIALPLTTMEIPGENIIQPNQNQSVLGASTVALAMNTEKVKPVAVQKPIVKKKAPVKKKVVKKKEKLTTTPALFTEATAPSSPRRR